MMTNAIDGTELEKQKGSNGRLKRQKKCTSLCLHSQSQLSLIWCHLCCVASNNRIAA